MAEAKGKARREVGNYLTQTRNLGNALLLTIPVLVTYNLGLLLGGRGVLNGADFITGFLYGQLGYSGYLIFQFAIVLVGGITGALLVRRGRFDFRHLPVLMGESLVYALTMGTLILFVMKEAQLLGPSMSQDGLGAVLVVSAGAGFYEEIVFRLGLLTALVMLFQRTFGWRPWVAMGVGLLVSSLVFSLAHYAGPESFSWFTFWYRTFAGLVFASVFLGRGFAAAVYTHFIYDVYVMMMR